MKFHIITQIIGVSVAQGRDWIGSLRWQFNPRLLSHVRLALGKTLNLINMPMPYIATVTIRV